jgi:hypothetical protein
MVSVASEKYSPVNGLIPLTNMWCPQTIMLSVPTATSDHTDSLYPNTGLRVNAGITSNTTPSAGRIRMYTSGWPRNQKRCCQSSGDPPVFGRRRLPITSPVGRKKLVPACRSNRSMIAAAVSGGNARRPTMEAMKYDQTVSGRRMSDNPRARMQNTVATMFRPLIVKRRDEKRHGEQPDGLAHL